MVLYYREGGKEQKVAVMVKRQPIYAQCFKEMGVYH